MVLYCMLNDALNSNMDMLISLVLTMWSFKHYSLIRTQPVHWCRRLFPNLLACLLAFFKEVSSLILWIISRQMNIFKRLCVCHRNKKKKKKLEPGQASTIWYRCNSWVDSKMNIPNKSWKQWTGFQVYDKRSIIVI